MKCRPTLAIALWITRLALGQDADVLVPGSPIERGIEPGQIHSYRMNVEKEQFLHVKASQLGSDVAIRVIDPNGKQFTTVDRLQYEGFEDLPWIADATGSIT